MNQNPEQIARDKIDSLLEQAGWKIQSKNKIDFSAGLGVAIREYQTDEGPADYVLFVNRKPVGVIEAKREEEGVNLTVVEEQSVRYANAKLKYLNNEPLKYIYETTGTLTRFTDYSDPKPRSRTVFAFHKPETFAEWIRIGRSLRNRLQDFPSLDTSGLRPAQIRAVVNLEESFKNNRPRALIQMATGAGKTFTAITFIYRLLKFAKAKRILFLVDTRNLGEQAEQEFMNFRPNDDNRKFTELYNVQRLSSSYIANDSQVCISTIQRLYSILKGEELDENAENDNPNESTWLQQKTKEQQAIPVEYTEKVPIEQFDFVVIDECHRSIYNLWKQVLDYFDAFLVGLTATPDKRTFGFFSENVVSEYTYEQSVVDGVNVPYDVYSIETEISKNGALIKAGWHIDYRNKTTRKTRWQQVDEDIEYKKNDLDKSVVNTSQIRTVIRQFRKALVEEIFPNRYDENGQYEVPKTLIFAKTDSHADDIIKIVREEFDEGNDFCKKVTYKIDEDPKSVLNRFRNQYYPRIAVTVDMIATGTDVKPLEVLLFMRDVRSANYFEQMKGRGTRTISSDSLQLVSRTAVAKTHFVIVDAVGVTQTKKTDSRPLERKPTVSLKDLLGAVTMGVVEEDLFTSLANRLIRLNKEVTEKEKERIEFLSKGKTLGQMSAELLATFDPDRIEDEVQKELQHIPPAEISPAVEEEIRQKVQTHLADVASATFNGELNEYIATVRTLHDQKIDSVNIDRVTLSAFNSFTVEKAQETVKSFAEYLEMHKEEILALSIFYNQPYNRRNITLQMVRELLEKLKQDKPLLAPTYVWDAYCAIENVKAAQPKSELTALISLVRHACGIDENLIAFDSTIEKNFNTWLFRQHTGNRNRFTSEQIEWLRMIKDHIVSSYHLDLDDLDYTPFDAQGGRGKMYQLFGDEMMTIIEELNEILVA
ncbi:MAG: DEAD/DEAH box helicase family protein [Paludibacteraceae bacterium]|nr:DEAD/DEAH box helicase family protein [Paludibacteraceae bacterium]